MDDALGRAELGGGMSWDADLTGELDGHPVHLGEWNFTHNCNDMANAALDPNYQQQGVFDEVFRPQTESWWKRLNGTTGPALLEQIITGLLANPAKYRAMNPDNGWGDYDSFLGVLQEMLDASRKYPSAKWEVGG